MRTQEDFQAALQALGFRLVEQRRDLHYERRESRYLTYHVHWDPADRSVLFTWELAVGELVADAGLQIGSNEPLNTFLYPQFDARGDEDGAFVEREMERTRQVLASLDLLAG